MASYFYADNVKVYMDLGIAMLVISFAIAALVLPYLKTWVSRIVNKKINLEKSQETLPYQLLSKRVTEIGEEETEKDGLKKWVFVNIFVFLVIVVLSWLILNQGGYHLLTVGDSVSSTAILWSIPNNAKLLDIVTTESVIKILPFLTLAGFIVMFSIIFQTYKLINKLMKDEAETPLEKKTFEEEVPASEAEPKLKLVEEE